jgi:hypothetical protein
MYENSLDLAITFRNSIRAGGYRSAVLSEGYLVLQVCQQVAHTDSACSSKLCPSILEGTGVNLVFLSLQVISFFGK